MDKNMILFLTACVNPKGMAYTKLSNPEIRLKQYKEALDWYLTHTSLKILLVENSGYDFSDSYRNQIGEGRLELLSYDGNSYDRSRGKGYGEAAIVEYGLQHSRFLRAFSQDTMLLKVTGRLLCKNINELFGRYHNSNTVYANLDKDDWGGNLASSQVVIAPVRFFSNYFLPRREEINDSQCRHFEHVLYDSIEDWKHSGGKHRMFWIPPVIEGMSGTSGVTINTQIKGGKLLRYRIMYFFRRFFGYRGYVNPFYHGQPKKPIQV